MTMFPFDDPASLVRLYHLNSEPWLNQEAYEDPTARPELAPLADRARAVRLPSSGAAGGETPLGALARQRRSCRAFEPRRMDLGLCGDLLQLAYGGIDLALVDDGGSRLARPVPSAGGLYPLELFVATTNVGDIADDVYHFNVLHHALEPADLPPRRGELASHFLAQEFLRHANLLVLVTAVFGRSLKKYGVRGYRYVLLEAGHLGQALILAATAAGLGTLCVGGFRDTGLNSFLGLDGQTQAVVYCVAVGHRADP